MFKRKYDIRKDIEDVRRRLQNIADLKELFNTPAWKLVKEEMEAVVQENMQSVLDLTFQGVDKNSREIEIKRNIAEYLGQVLSNLQAPLEEEQNTLQELGRLTTKAEPA